MDLLAGPERAPPSPSEPAPPRVPAAMLPVKSAAADEATPPPVAAPRDVPGASASAPPVAMVMPAVPQAEVGADPRPIMPPGMRLPVANYGADGGVRFPLSGDGIRAAVADARPQVRECYEAWLKVNPQLQGRLKVAFRITSDGGTEATIDQVHLVGDAGMGNLAFEGCVLSVMSGLHFDPPPQGALEVTYPLSFSSADAGS
ncbi:MAG: AgmX/PglI C-terminal domain-containing protein [Archangiaceae bacterium]|nr:AgmX/PglI C-terminal domain-containing protein [Archangiaceae bacterium]